MKPLLRQALVTAAGVLLAAAYVTVIKAGGFEMDWATLGIGALALFGVVYVIGIPSKGEGEG